MLLVLLFFVTLHVNLVEDMFNFKQFSVVDDKCAMKVGMDSVLLGSWANVNGANRVLDIGAGSGILSLMVAQRNSVAQIIGVEISRGAAFNASNNFEASPWRERLSVVLDDISRYQADRFDCIVSNPPYFDGKLPKTMISERQRARHTIGLSFDILAYSASRLMNDDGRFSLVLPVDSYTEFSQVAANYDLFEHRKLYVAPRVNKTPNRVLLEYRKSMVKTPDVAWLSLRASHGSYSRDYELLTQDFYLKDI